MRILLAHILLWYNMLSMSIYIGGTVYQMLVIVPLWSASPPESVRAFFKQTEFKRTVRKFFGPRIMPWRALPLLLGLIAGWNLPAHRLWLLIPVVCMIFGLVMTFAYIYPINDGLFEQAGGNRSPDEVRAMARRWILADRIRFAIMAAGFLCLLRALSLPFSPALGS